MLFELNKYVLMYWLIIYKKHIIYALDLFCSLKRQRMRTTSNTPPGNLTMPDWQSAWDLSRASSSG